MATVATSTSQDSPPANTDFAAIKSRQHGAWSSGDYAVVGTTLQIVGEELCEALDIRAHDYVLDVAAGNGNASIAPANAPKQIGSTSGSWRRMRRRYRSPAVVSTS